MKLHFDGRDTHAFHTYFLIIVQIWLCTIIRRVMTTAFSDEADNDIDIYDMTRVVAIVNAAFKSYENMHPAFAVAANNNESAASIGRPPASAFAVNPAPPVALAAAAAAGVVAMAAVAPVAAGVGAAAAMSAAIAPVVVLAASLVAERNNPLLLPMALFDGDKIGRGQSSRFHSLLGLVHHHQAAVEAVSLIVGVILIQHTKFAIFDHGRAWQTERADLRKRGVDYQLLSQTISREAKPILEYKYDDHDWFKKVFDASSSNRNAVSSRRRLSAFTSIIERMVRQS